METIGQPIQQIVGLLAEILRSRAQPNFIRSIKCLHIPEILSIKVILHKIATQIMN